MAEIQLADRCRELADKHAVPITGVSVRDQRSRWGSCSARGSISLNWRLIRMPEFVSDYVILHELMHRRQPNHSARFWNEVGQVCPEWREAERVSETVPIRADPPVFSNAQTRAGDGAMLVIDSGTHS